MKEADIATPPLTSSMKQLALNAAGEPMVPAEHEPRIFRLSAMEPQQHGDCYVLLAAKERSKTKEGRPYYRVTFRDAHRAASAMIWSDGGWFADCDERWKVGEFYKVRCRYFENQYGPHLEIEKIRPVEDADRKEGFDPGDFFRTTRFDPERMFAELVTLAEREITDAPLRQLTVGLLNDHAELIQRMAAAANHHHAFRGGFVEHILSVTRTALYLAAKYQGYYPDMRPPLSKSLVVAGAILHDIGKTQELDHLPQGAEYTAKGRLIGHILLGRDMVRDKAREISDLDPETLLRLEHIIVAHQNLPEWGSPIAPHTPEALLVHYADDIDAKFHMMASALEDDTTSHDEFTTRDNPLRRRVFRGLKS